MLTVVVVRGPIPTPAGDGFESATLKVFVGWWTVFGDAIR
jgi:hypothetical protein